MMKDSKSQRSAGPFTAQQIADHVGGEVEGDGEVQLTDVRGLEEAEPGHLSFAVSRKFLPQVEASAAAAVLVDPKLPIAGRTVIRCRDPYAAFARAAQLFHPVAWPEPGVAAQAWVAEDAQVEGATIEAFAWVGPGAEVGEGSWIESGSYVGAGTRIGRGCRLMPHSVVYPDCVLGDRVWLNPGAVLGGEGFGFAPHPELHVKIPQMGRVVIEDDVEIGANTCVDRATMGDTVVRRGSKLDNLVQIGHGSEVGEGVLMAAYAAVAGSGKVGPRTMMGGKSGVLNHAEVGAGTQIASGSIASGKHPDGARLGGTPAIDLRRWMRASTAFADLPEMLKRIRRLEARVAELEDAEEKD